jgi:hypothetical protein
MPAASGPVGTETRGGPVQDPVRTGPMRLSDNHARPPPPAAAARQVTAPAGAGADSEGKTHDSFPAEGGVRLGDRSSEKPTSFFAIFAPAGADS